jgi:hypothetical protein
MGPHCPCSCWMLTAGFRQVCGLQVSTAPISPHCASWFPLWFGHEVSPAKGSYVESLVSSWWSIEMWLDHKGINSHQWLTIAEWVIRRCGLVGVTGSMPLKVVSCPWTFPLCSLSASQATWGEHLSLPRAPAVMILCLITVQKQETQVTMNWDHWNH